MNLHCVATMIHIPSMTTTDCRACANAKTSPYGRRALLTECNTEAYLRRELQVEDGQVVWCQQSHRREHVTEVS